MIKTLQSEAKLPTEYGVFQMMAFAEHPDDEMPILVLQSHKKPKNNVYPLRIHSECVTGDLFHSQKCDCGKQLDFALKYIAERGGLLIYLRQEGRGIGIINKLKAYQLQEDGLDTAEANITLGLPTDARTYEDVLDILSYLNIQKVELLTNNPDKVSVFENSSIQLRSRIPIIIPEQPENKEYLQTKKTFFKHLL